MMDTSPAPMPERSSWGWTSRTRRVPRRIGPRISPPSGMRRCCWCTPWRGCRRTLRSGRCRRGCASCSTRPCGPGWTRSNPRSSRAVPVERLVRRSAGARMLVLGSYGDGGWSGMLAGSNALGLLARAACPVAVVRGAAPQVPPPRSGPVVVGVDGSVAGAAALELAADLAGVRRVRDWSRCTPATTWSPAPGRWRPPPARARRDPRGRGRGTAGARTPARCRPPPRPAGGTARRCGHTRCGTCSPVPRVRGCWWSGSDDPHRLEGMLLGSTSRGLVEFAPCPVVVVPLPPAQRHPVADRGGESRRG